MAKKDMLRELLKGIADLPEEMIGELCSLVTALCGNGWEIWFSELKKFRRKEKYWFTGPECTLRMTLGGEFFGVHSADGKLDRGCHAEDVGHTYLYVYELMKLKYATLSQIFNSFPYEMREICFTREQIDAFAKEYYYWLSSKDVRGGETFFLFEKAGNYTVMGLCVSEPGQEVIKTEYQLGLAHLCGTLSKVWFAIPQLDHGELFDRFNDNFSRSRRT